MEAGEGAELCSWNRWPDGNSPELCQGRVRLGSKKHLFTVRIVKHWNRLPREVVDVPGLSVLKRHSDNALSNILQFLVSTEEVRELDFLIFEGLFQLFYFTLFCSDLLCSSLLYSTLFLFYKVLSAVITRKAECFLEILLSKTSKVEVKKHVRS